MFYLTNFHNKNDIRLPYTEKKIEKITPEDGPEYLYVYERYIHFFCIIHCIDFYLKIFNNY